nr:hypothetical protein [Tanacetum cinerariifolium]
MYGESMERFPKSTNAQAEAFEQTMCTKEEKVECGVEKEKEIKVIVRYLTNPFLDSLEKLGSDRIKIWEGSPFYDLLKMKRDVQDNDMIKRLASLFNIKDRSLEIGGINFIVTAEDFTDIMGIKDGDEEVEMAPKHTEKSPTELKRIFSNSKKVKFDIDNKNVIEQLTHSVVTHSVDEDTVKRAYALYALRDIICAPAKECKGTERERYLGGCTIFLQLYVMRKMSGTIPKDIADETVGDVGKETWHFDKGAVFDHRKEIALYKLIVEAHTPHHKDVLLVAMAMTALPELSAQGISNIAWALSKIRGEFLYLPEMDRVADVGLTKVVDFDSKNIANVALAFASMKHSAPRLFTELSK